jgi:membrane-associated phospholipid phosphatase
VTEHTQQPAVLWDARVALFVTEAASPTLLLGLVAVVVGWQSSWPSASGLLWGTVAAFFCAALPHMILVYGVRHQRWSDRHVRVRQQHPLPLLLTTFSVAVGLLLVCLAPSASADLVQVTVVMLTGAVAILTVSLFWKISIHTSVAAYSTTMFVLTFGPLWLSAGPVVAVVAWSRIRLGDHTPSQVLGGILLGAVIPIVVYAALR